MPGSVLLFSGGLDSTVALYDLRSRKSDVVALSLFYGQRHSVELQSAQKIATRLNVELIQSDIGALQSLFGKNSQTNSTIDVPLGHYTEESMKQTVVPNRNMIFLSCAIALAVSRKFDEVVYAAHGGDHAIYPDCRPEFVKLMDSVSQICDWHPVHVVAPFVHLTKGEIVKRGLSLDVPFAETWSCYQGQTRHCGHCGTCVERKEAFEMAGVADPTIYES